MEMQAPPPQLPPPGPTARRGLAIIVLFLGALLLMVGLLPFMVADPASGYEAGDYPPGQQFIMRGSITDVGEIPYTNRTVYELDENVYVVSDRDLGEEGDTVYLECVPTSQWYYYLWDENVVEATSGPISVLWAIFGVVVLVLGILLLAAWRRR
jgi:hypothetical protein